MSAFLIIRHAQSTWNATGRWQGQADPPLSPVGESLTAEAAARLAGTDPFEMVVTSDLDRARRTGELLAGRDPARVLVEPALREFHVGRWSGLTRNEIQGLWPTELALFDAGRLAAAPGGETRTDFDKRVWAAADRVARLIHRHRSGRTLIVTHGGVIRSLARRAGLEERHVPNLAGYAGTAGPEGLAFHRPVDLRDDPDQDLAGPVAL